MTTLLEMIEHRLEIVPLTDKEKKEEIVDALGDAWTGRQYKGFDMSGYGFGDDERTMLGMEKCRIDNWLLFIEKFRDYCSIEPNEFQLWSWQGSIWWGDAQASRANAFSAPVKEFTGSSTAEIIEWIIKKFGRNDVRK